MAFPLFGFSVAGPIAGTFASGNFGVGLGVGIALPIFTALLAALTTPFAILMAPIPLAIAGGLTIGMSGAGTFALLFH